MALETRGLAVELRKSFEAGERRKFKLDAFQPLMFKGLEKGWNELTAQIERERKHLQEVFQPVRAEKQSGPRIEAAE